VDLRTTVMSLGGEVIEIEHREGTNIPETIVVEIPSEKYPSLLVELSRLGVIRQAPPGDTVESDEGVVRVKISLQFE
jgi:hypothetical protein